MKKLALLGEFLIEIVHCFFEANLTLRELNDRMISKRRSNKTFVFIPFLVGKNNKRRAANSKTINEKLGKIKRNCSRNTKQMHMLSINLFVVLPLADVCAAVFFLSLVESLISIQCAVPQKTKERRTSDAIVFRMVSVDADAGDKTRLVAHLLTL